MHSEILSPPNPERRWHIVLPAVFLCALTGLSGCSNLGVKPHQRGLLAKESMLLVPDAVEAGLDDHIYFSKEATSGGRGFGGGGCGCN